MSPSEATIGPLKTTKGPLKATFGLPEATLFLLKPEIPAFRDLTLWGHDPPGVMADCNVGSLSDDNILY